MGKETPMSPPASSRGAEDVEGATDTAALEMDDKSQEHKKPPLNGDDKKPPLNGDDEEEHEDGTKRRPSFSSGKWKQDDGEQPEEEEEETTILDKILAVFSLPFEIIFNY